MGSQDKLFPSAEPGYFSLLTSRVRLCFAGLLHVVFFGAILFLARPGNLAAAESTSGSSAPALGSRGVISLNFVGSGTPMDGSETAGVIAKANWNQAAGATNGTTPLSLVDENGIPTGATANWTADAASVADTPDAPGNARMMNGYLDTPDGNPSTVRISGLTAGKYTIYVYANSANAYYSGTNTFQIGGPGVNETAIAFSGAQLGLFSGTFLEANGSVGNYVLFKQITVLSSFTLTATPTTTIPGFPLSAPVNGIQIVPAGADPDFSIAVLPMSQSVISGGTAAYLVNVEALSGFSGVVKLSLSPETPPPGATESIFPSAVKGSGSAIVTVHTTTNSFNGTWTQVVTGTSGTLSHAAEVSTTALAAPDFGLINSTYYQLVTAGGTATYLVEVAGANFTGKVDLSVIGLPAGATASFSPASLYSSGWSTLTIQTTAMTPTGEYSPLLAGSSGALAHTTVLELQVQSAPDFSLSAGPTSQTSTGATAKYLVGVTALSGFTGSVGLGVSGLPPNTTARFSPPTSSGSGTSVLTITSNGAFPSGATTITITGTSGSLSHATTVTLMSGTAPDFSISVGPPELGYGAQGGPYPVLIQALNGFTGTVNLSASGLPSGTTASFAPSSVTAFPGGSTVTISFSPPPGSTGSTTTITITGTSGSLSHGVPLTFDTVSGEDFVVTSPSASQLVTAGSAATFPIAVESTSPNNSFGSVNLSVVGLPAGATASFDNPAPEFPELFYGDVNLTIVTTAETPPGISLLTITGTSGTLSHTATLTLTVFQPGTEPVISVDFVGGGTPMAPSESAGIVARANWNVATGNASSTPLNLVDQTGSATGATLSWTSDNVWSLPIADSPGNFRMMRGYLDNGANDPTTVTLSGIAPGVYDIYVYINGDNGSTARTGIYYLSPTATYVPSVNATDPAGVNFSGTFVQANNSNGNYVLFSGVPLESPGYVPAGFTLTASPDGASRAPVNGLQIALSSGPASSFSVSSVQNSQTVVPGGSVAYSINVVPLNGFSGPVNFYASGSETPQGLSISLNPSVVTSLPAALVLTVTTTGATPLGSSSLIVTGSSGNTTSTALVDFVVEPSGGTAVTSIDFVGSASAMAKSEPAGVLIRENWNDALGAKSSAPLQLVDENGSRSGATVTWSADDAQITTIADLAGNFRMMRGYLDTGAGNPTSVTVAGLTAGTYSIYVYVDGNNGGATDTATYQISGPGILTSSATATDSANTDFSGTFFQADNGDGNYIVFSNISVTSGFTLTATPVLPGTSAPVNAIQIVH
jgi:hypothetical protein